MDTNTENILKEAHSKELFDRLKDIYSEVYNFSNNTLDLCGYLYQIQTNTNFGCRGLPGICGEIIPQIGCINYWIDFIESDIDAIKGFLQKEEILTALQKDEKCSKLLSDFYVKACTIRADIYFAKTRYVGNDLYGLKECIGMSNTSGEYDKTIQSIQEQLKLIRLELDLTKNVYLTLKENNESEYV